MTSNGYRHTYIYVCVYVSWTSTLGKALIECTYCVNLDLLICGSGGGGQPFILPTPIQADGLSLRLGKTRLDV